MFKYSRTRSTQGRTMTPKERTSQQLHTSEITARWFRTVQSSFMYYSASQEQSKVFHCLVQPGMSKPAAEQTGGGIGNGCIFKCLHSCDERKKPHKNRLLSFHKSIRGLCVVKLYINRNPGFRCTSRLRVLAVKHTKRCRRVIRQ